MPGLRQALPLAVAQWLLGVVGPAAVDTRPTCSTSKYIALGGNGFEFLTHAESHADEVRPDYRLGQRKFPMSGHFPTGLGTRPQKSTIKIHLLRTFSTDQYFQ
jgi:hypothetical protein